MYLPLPFVIPTNYNKINNKNNQTKKTKTNKKNKEKQQQQKNNKKHKTETLCKIKNNMLETPLVEM